MHTAAFTNTIPPPVTAKQRVVIIPGDQPEEEIDGYGGKDFEKREVLRRSRKCHEEGKLNYLVTNCRVMVV